MRRNMVDRAVTAVVYGALANKLTQASAQDAYGVTSTVIEYVTEIPTVTAVGGNLERQPCACPTNIAVGHANVFGSMPTGTIEPNVMFAIHVVIDEQDADVGLQGTQYLGIGRPYVFIFPGPPIPPWYLDDEQNLVFDHTGLNLAIAPMNLPAVSRRGLEARDDSDDEDDDDDDYETIVAGNSTMPPGGSIFSKWTLGPPADGGQELFVVDVVQRPVGLTYLACYEDAPLFNKSIWQLEAMYDYQSLTPTSCVPAKLVASIPASSHTSFHTATYTPTTTPAPSSSTSPRPTSFPIIVDIDISGAERRQAASNTRPGDVWYLTQDESAAGIIPIAQQNIQPPYWSANRRRELHNEATGQILEIPRLSGRTLDTSTSHLNSNLALEPTAFDRFAILANDTIRIIYGDMLSIPYIACPTDVISNIYNLSAAFAADVSNLLSTNPDCIIVSLSAGTDNPAPTTMDTTITVESTTTPYQTVTALDPNISGCNAVDYSEAYATPSLSIADFATACFCWSFVAETVSDTSTVSCTPTIIEIEPSITSISVSGILQTDSDDPITDGEGLSRRAIAQDINTPTDATTTWGDIIAIPTPPDLESLATASPSAVSDVCTQLLQANDVDTLTITTIEVVSVTVANITSTTTSTQTVCYEMGTVVYETGTVSTSVAVICPATVTAGGRM
ncbi:hypothetical protein Dda_0193 [Drechslerella dactyloides]|uniref:Uncharacterized protein n=1 Tax=Drechslerella dactyloides TaxID=74499 RepID=A0AAD6NP02_DREDA|nr:hypothetical protein Dda_0193 [Drechslerella dactyloides]